MEKAAKAFLFTILGLFLFSATGNVLQYCNPPEPIIKTKIETKTQIDTVYRSKYITVQKIQAKLDTVYIDNAPQMVASADTLIRQDSSAVKIKYYFPPMNKFEVTMKLRDRYITRVDSIFKTIEKTLPYNPGFFDRLGLSVQAGFGQGMIHKQFDFYYGVGISYKLN